MNIYGGRKGREGREGRKKAGREEGGEEGYIHHEPGGLLREKRSFLLKPQYSSVK